MEKAKNCIMDIEINIDIGNLDRQLEKMALRAGTMMPIAPAAQNKLRLANIENFTSNGLPSGGWSPLDAQYGAWKAIRFPGAPPMVRSGKLFSSLASLTNTATKITKDSFEFGTTVSYAKFHQMGTSKMPKRQVVFVPRGFAEWLGSSYAKWVVEGELP
jgi:phage gpG-like protein